VNKRNNYEHNFTNERKGTIVYGTIAIYEEGVDFTRTDGYILMRENERR